MLNKYRGGRKSTINPKKMSGSGSFSEDSGWVKCGVCGEKILEDNTNTLVCCECGESFCDHHSHTYCGCEYLEELICKKCRGKPIYCDDSDCECDNKHPSVLGKRKAAEQRRQQLEERGAAALQQHFTAARIAEWKAAHPAIAYAGKYRGVYLVDLVLSSDAFKRGYLDWVLRQGNAYTAEFKAIQAEARELETLRNELALRNNGRPKREKKTPSE
jgi:hypothetical protein